ncbi:AAA family ATPase [candidate division KSB1 bacterium]|nr:AAA family ATPase [candidate division KSB1 bacterium]
MPILKKITEIKNYKSYNHFKWDEFEKYEKYDKKTGGKKEVAAEFDNGFNVIFGENGSGKSAIVQVLKSLSQNGEFIDSSPEKVALQFKDTVYTFENDQWLDNKRLDNTDIVFFDTEFISTNVHTNGCRETAINKGAHTQNSGKLLIEFDGEALRLKNEYEIAETAFHEYKKNNKADLEFKLTDDELIIFEALKDKEKSEITKIQNNLPAEIDKLKSGIEQLENNKTKINEIQSIDRKF